MPLGVSEVHGSYLWIFVSFFSVVVDTREPSVDHVLGTSPSQLMAKVEPRKSTIGQRKPMQKKGVRE